MKTKRVLCWGGIGLMAVNGWMACAEQVFESDREIPVAYDVDVVVVGGGVGAVSAASAAARKGAKVFLATPRAYLGGTMAATLQTWIPGDRELANHPARDFFEGTAVPDDAPPPSCRLPLTYSADLPSGPPHRDTSKPSYLTDGEWGSAVKASVQYGGDVTVTADLGNVCTADQAIVYVFNAKDFIVGAVTAASSTDGKRWTPLEAPPVAFEMRDEYAAAIPVAFALKQQPARFVRFTVNRAEGSTRILLGEVMVATDQPARQAASAAPRLVRPLLLKRALDARLIADDVAFLFGCYVTDILRDAAGNPAGIIMANRAGRQAVRAKVVIDATDRAWVARMAGAKAVPFPAGPQAFTRVVIGGKVPELREGVTCRTLPFKADGFPVYEFALSLPMRDGSFRSYAEAEQKARDLTYCEGQQAAADNLFQVPPDPIVCRGTVPSSWPGASAVALDCFRPKSLARLYVLGGCGGVSRRDAATVIEPLELTVLGARIGEAAAAEAAQTGAVTIVPPAAPASPTTGPGDVREALAGPRSLASQPLPRISRPVNALPVVATCDVVVVGGGTAGAPAGIAAARQGAQTLVLEYQNGLGGVGTIGRISSYYWGNRVGFTKTVPGEKTWPVEERMEWWRRQLLEAGGHVWFGALVCGAYIEKGHVAGVVVATPEGRGVVKARAVIDATGNSDVAAAAGATCIYTDGSDVALQGTGLPPRQLGRDYTNTDYSLVDETDMLDVWRMYVLGKRMSDKAFDFGTLIDTRERRRIVGDYTITIEDQLLSYTHPDTVVDAYSNFDTHGYTIDPFFTITYPHKKGLRTYIPYRAMLPKGLDGILVVGLGISAQRDAVPCIRMEPDIQNGGYAAGVAAAMAAENGCPPRDIDVRALQRHLVELGNLKEHVLTDAEHTAFAEDRVAAAVAGAAADDAHEDVAVLMTQPKTSLPLLRKAYADAKTDTARLRYAQILGILGDASGLEDILRAVENAPGLDAGWKYRGMGQFGSCMSPLDSLFYALGAIGDRRATPALIRKLNQMTPESEFSHFRALSVALEQLRDPAAAEPLATLLGQPGIANQSVTTGKDILATADANPSFTATEPRAKALSELLLARALYRCGDWQGVGQTVLERYTSDLRGHFARHAAAVLAAGRGPADSGGNAR